MGKLKVRVYPKDITINIGPEAKIPPLPEVYRDQTWKEIRHDNTVTWLAYWKARTPSRLLHQAQRRPRCSWIWQRWLWKVVGVRETVWQRQANPGVLLNVFPCRTQ